MEVGAIGLEFAQWQFLKCLRQSSHVLADIIKAPVKG